MKYKIQSLASGKIPDDEMCRAVAAMFPTFIDDSNVHLTRIEAGAQSYLAKTPYKDFPIEGEAAALASEVRATAMAAHRYRNKQYRGRTRRESQLSGSDVSLSEVRAMREARKGMKIPESPAAEESDAALMGLDDESEGEQDGSDEEGAEEDEDEG